MKPDFFLETHDKHPLPAKYSPSLNKVKECLKNIYTNHTYQSIEELKDTTKQYLKKNHSKHLDLT